MINNLEKKLDIKYPELYKKLEEQKMLCIDSDGEKIIPTLLYADDEFWLLSENDILIEIDDFYDEEHYLQVNNKYLFIPFAKSGAGDLYCFLFSHKDNYGNIPIIYFWHDDEKATYLSKNLEDFIFMKLLSYITQTGSINLLNKNNLDKLFLLESHKDFIKSSYFKILVEKYTVYDKNKLMPDNEYYKILKNNIIFKNYNKSFNYQV